MTAPDSLPLHALAEDNPAGGTSEWGGVCER